MIMTKFKSKKIGRSLHLEEKCCLFPMIRYNIECCILENLKLTKLEFKLYRISKTNACPEVLGWTKSNQKFCLVLLSKFFRVSIHQKKPRKKCDTWGVKKCDPICTQYLYSKKQLIFRDASEQWFFLFFHENNVFLRPKHIFY